MYEPFQTQPRRVDWARAGVYEYVVQETARGTPSEKRDDRDPEVVAPSSPHLGPIPDHVGHQPRPEILSKEAISVNVQEWYMSVEEGLELIVDARRIGESCGVSAQRGETCTASVRTRPAGATAQTEAGPASSRSRAAILSCLNTCRMFATSSSLSPLLCVLWMTSCSLSS